MSNETLEISEGTPYTHVVWLQMDSGSPNTLTDDKLLVIKNFAGHLTTEAFMLYKKVDGKVQKQFGKISWEAGAGETPSSTPPRFPLT
ncbi:unnamed protein product [marine sediment metagenome]|uniref:Uncharacterized protein n=1 Tax=marine sediment metagenome TaxID=412755 RepID=X0YZC6_9ZZZZ